jgi:formiminotetrahydrofolate cyclodeaminase
MSSAERSSIDPPAASPRHPFRETHLTVSALAFEAYVRKLSSGDPTPGGGSAAAATGAFAAALVRMVAALTAGSPKFKDVAQRATAIGVEAERLMEVLLRSVDEDVSAFDAVTAAYKMPKSSDAEKAARSTAIQDALRAATEPPMRVVDASVAACRLAAELVDYGNPSAISDVGCAALFAGAAAQGAALNVGINAKSLKDRAAADAYAERVRSALAQVDLLTEVVFGKVRAAVAATA